jgi:hypothetical protein
MNSKTGFIVTLIRANTSAVIIAVKKLSISNSFVSLPTANIEKAKIKN